MRNTYSFFLNAKKHWHSKWYTDANYGELIHQDLAVREYIGSILKQNNLIYNRAIIKRSNKDTIIYIRLYDNSYGIKRQHQVLIKKKQPKKKDRRIQKTSIFTKHPLVYRNRYRFRKIEIEGKHLVKILRNLSELLGTDVKLRFLISSSMDAEMIAQLVGRLVERRKSFSAITRMIQSTIKSNKRIQGIRIQCSGRPTGKPMAFIKCFRHGPIFPTTYDANVDYAHATAWTKFGICGIKVWVNFL